MNRKAIILKYRTSRMIKGHKPAIIFLSRCVDKIYDGGQADFIMSLGKEYLYFQRLSFLTKKLLPKKDFKLAIDCISSYMVVQKNIVTNVLTFYTKERNFIQINYFLGTPDTCESEENIKSIIKELNARGIRHEKGSDF